VDRDRPPSSAPTGDAVVGVFARDRLSEALVATHRAGFGAHARVLDGGRGDLQEQLRRAGWAAPLSPDLDPGAVLVLVNAPGRAGRVADLLARAGADVVLLVGRPGAVPSPVDAPTPGAPPPAAEVAVDP